MILSRTEFLLMNNPVRRLIQKQVEFKLFKNYLIKHQIDLRGKVIMDAGCGSGYSTKMIWEEYRPKRLIAFDLMPEQIKLAKKRGLGVDFYVGDVTRIDLTESSCDATFIFGILHHIFEWRHALKEVARVLKPGGVLLVEEPRIGFDWQEFESGLNRVGLEVLENRKIWTDSFRSFLCQKVR